MTANWYAFLASGPGLLTSLLTPKAKAVKQIQRRLSSAASSWADKGADALDEAQSTPIRLTSGQCQQTYAFAGGGLTVRLAVSEVTSDLCHVTPYVYCAPDNSAVIVFSGFLSNVHELATRHTSHESPSTPSRRGSLDSSRSGSAGARQQQRFSSPSEEACPPGRRGSLERSLDIGTLTASTVLALYAAQHDPGSELILLSELQGQYAFVIFDSTKRQAFAARDPSGLEPLFFCASEDGAVSFSSSAIDVPGSERASDWQELPPGHYVAGKPPRLYQFALTPEQLQVRDRDEESEATCVTGQRLSYDGSLSSRSLTKQRSLDLSLSVFSLEL